MKVLLTHGEGRLEGLASALGAQGLSVAHIPLIRTEPLPPAGVRPAAAALLTHDWLLFTSRTAVAVWADLGLPLSGILPKIGVVGEKTREVVAELGGNVALVARPAHAQGLLETFLERVTKPARVGLPCGEDALQTLSEGLRAAGCLVTRVPLYRTVPHPLPRLDADLVVLASPSAVAALPQFLPPETRFVALGPSTRAALEERGLETTLSPTPDVRGVVGAVLQALTPGSTLLASSAVWETP